MKKKTKPGTVEVYLEPDVMEMLHEVAKVEGLTPEKVLESLLDNYRNEQEAAR